MRNYGALFFISLQFQPFKNPTISLSVNKTLTLFSSILYKIVVKNKRF